MALKLKSPEQLELPPPAAPTAEHSDGPAPIVSDARNTEVRYGIRGGVFPVRGMQVGDARRVLRQVMNIDPSAVAVIGGRPVEDHEVIGADVTMLSFVKPSALKG